jgi:uncharacterized protein
MNLLEKKPILHAILWILLYIAAVNVGDAASEMTGATGLTGALLIVLSAVLFFYLKKKRRLTCFGLCMVTIPVARKVLFYLPLIVLAFIQLLAWVPSAAAASDAAVTCLFMIGTGFVEEVIFRGFLYQSIARRRSIAAAILISGATFGLGHIVNLLRGYTSLMQAEQIVTAVVIGILLAMLAAITRSIIPGILFHIVFNITGTIADPNGNAQTGLLIAILAIGALYSAWLIRYLPKKEVTET